MRIDSLRIVEYTIVLNFNYMCYISAVHHPKISNLLPDASAVSLQLDICSEQSILFIASYTGSEQWVPELYK